MRPLLHSAIALILTSTQFSLSIVVALVRALLLQRRPGDNRLSQRLQRFACTVMMLVMLSNTALAGPVVSQAMASSVLMSVVEWKQELSFRWRASG